MLPGHLENPAVRPFCYQGVAVGQALGRADIRTVEAVGIQRGLESGLCGRILPFNSQRHRIDLQNPGMVPQRILLAVRGGRVGKSITRPAAVVENEQIAFSGQPLGDDMGMMLADDPSDLPELRGGIIRSQPPDDPA
ncbi:hypothetical protein D3C75_914200 [compost metagenome]